MTDRSIHSHVIAPIFLYVAIARAAIALQVIESAPAAVATHHLTLILNFAFAVQ